MHRAALIPVEVPERRPGRQQVVDGRHRVAGVDEDGGGVLRAGCVGVRVGDS